MKSFVLLHHNGKIVGTAKYFTCGSTMPVRKLHGLSLSNYAGAGEDLVVVHHVQIFREHLNVRYPYSFGGPEPPPGTLGDMNKVEKYFKAFIAWDYHMLSAQDWGCDLRDQPVSVSESVLVDRGKSSTPNAVNLETVTHLRTTDVNREIYPLSGESTAGKDDSFTRAQAGSTSFSVRRFSRIRGKRLSSASAFCPPRADTDGWILQSGDCERELDRERRANRIQSRKRRFGEFLNDEEGAESEAEVEPVKETESENASHASGDGSLREPRKVPDDGVDSIQPEYPSILADSVNESADGNRESLQLESEEEELEVEDSDSDESVESQACKNVLPLPRKRAYVYHSRKRGTTAGPRDLRKRRIVLSQRFDNPFLRAGLHCCKSLKCFEEVDPIFAFKTYKDVMKMNREDYKSFLIGLYDAEESCFVISGRRVCARYLQKGFGFSNDLQSSVKGTPCAPAGPTAAALPRLVISKKRDAIINFLQDYAEEIGDMMPNALFTNLPEVRRKDVYEKLKTHFRRHYSNEEPPSLNFFYAVWKSHCKNVRTRRNHGFAKCEVCIFLKNEIADNQRRKSVVRRARKMLQEHLNMVKEERRQYGHRKERARKQPTKYMSIVVDGADQKAFGLPHFLENSKSDRGHKLKVKCIGCLQHASTNKLRLYIMTDELLTGANHIIEVVHRSLADHKGEEGRFAQVLYVQVDNCTRENKNRYLIGYFELLVALGVFLEVEISFLPVGHTHIDIDQTFSSVGHALERRDAPTLTELMNLLRSCYNERTSVERLNRIVNFSGLCEESKAIVKARSIRGFTGFRYFRFSRATGNTVNGETFRTQCHVKVQGRDNWEPFSYGAVKGFLTSIPDLQQTPRTETFPPDNVTEVNQCLASLYGRTRLNAPRIISALEPLRDEVYTKRFDSMHWNVEESFEMNGDFRGDEYDEDDDDWIEGGTQEPADESNDDTPEYEPESFVAVKTDATTKSPFWVAMVLEVLDRSTSNRPRWIRVLWYSQKSGSSDDFAARYVPCQVYDSKRKTRVPYEDQIEVDSVVLRFPALNTQGYLRANTRTALRQILGLN